MTITKKANHKVAKRLISHISRQGLGPGDRLPTIRRLASHLKVSPSAIRDGIMHLQTIGVLDVQPRLGATIQSVDYKPMVDLFQQTNLIGLTMQDHNLFSLIDARLVIELETVEKAAQKRTDEVMYPVFQAYQLMEEHRNDEQQFIPADEQFHLAIAQVAGNDVLRSMLEALLTLLRPYQFGLLRDTEAIDGMQNRHLELYRSIMAGDGQRAQDITREASKSQYQELGRRLMNPEVPTHAMIDENPINEESIE